MFARETTKRQAMPVYEFEGVRPELPAADKHWIAPDANLVGKVRLAENTSVWFGAVLRGDNEWIEIGHSSNVQDGCVLHTDPGYPLKVGEGCTVGHRAILHPQPDLGLRLDQTFHQITPTALPAAANASSAKSRSSSVNRAFICVRIRARPCGTTG